MAKAALFVGWGALIPGREEAGGNVLAGAMQYLHQLQAEGRIDSFEAVALDPHGGDLAGFVLVKGDAEAIAELRMSDDFTRIVVRVQRVHQSVGVVGGYTGAEMQALFALWNDPIEGLSP
jgi:hypothetical protein